MKYLTLVRHAKSSWKDTDLQDFDRPLNSRGQRDLSGLAERIQQDLPRPDQLLFSPARRTQLTQEPLVVAWQLEPWQVVAVPEAYEASTSLLLMRLQQTAAGVQHQILVGHNPGLSDLISLLTGNLMDYFPTAAFAHLELQIDNWSQLAAHTARLLQFDYPKLHDKDSPGKSR